MSWGVVGSYSWWWKCSRMYCVDLQLSDSMTSCWMAHFAQEDYTPGKSHLQCASERTGQSCVLCASEIILIFVILVVFITLVWSHVLAGHSLEWRGSRACCRVKVLMAFLWLLFSACFLSFIKSCFHLYFCDYMCSFILCYLCVWQE